jgi:ABC-type microcin C transport system duplicated ATPase subunit YejF
LPGQDEKLPGSSRARAAQSSEPASSSFHAVWGVQWQPADNRCVLQQEFDLTYLFIAHDLALVRQVSQRVAVMYLGGIVEIGTREQIYTTPTHPYTHACSPRFRYEPT